MEDARWTESIMVLILLGAILGVLAPSAQADHNPKITAHCAYEVGQGDAHGISRPDPVGVTPDGYVNQGACHYEFPGATSDPWFHEKNEGVKIEGQYSTMQATVVDDVFGTTVGARLCFNFDDNRLCGDHEKEIVLSFCGTSPVLDSAVDSDGDGHRDFGSYIAVYVMGPINQAMSCDPAAAPIGGTSGGILNPSGGIFVALSG